jgi:tetratricopeptide (TPR) repeat protein
MIMAVFMGSSNCLDTCEKTLELLDQGSKPSFDYALSVFNSCQCFERNGNKGNSRKCYEIVRDSCIKIAKNDDSYVESVGLKLEATDSIDKIMNKAYEKPPGARCTCTMDNSRGSLIADYDGIIEANRSNVVAWNDRGVLLGELCCLDESLKSFNETISINSLLSRPWYNKGVLLYSNDPAEALKCFNRSVELDPSLAEGWFNRYALLRPKKIDTNDLSSKIAYQEAANSLNRAIELNGELEYYEPPYLEFKRMID